jgi:hypothetical protein
MPNPQPIVFALKCGTARLFTALHEPLAIASLTTKAPRHQEGPCALPKVQLAVNFSRRCMQDLQNAR